MDVCCVEESAGWEMDMVGSGFGVCFEAVVLEGGGWRTGRPAREAMIWVVPFAVWRWVPGPAT